MIQKSDRLAPLGVRENGVLTGFRRFHSARCSAWWPTPAADWTPLPRPPVARSSDVDSIGPGEAVKPVCPALAEGPELP